MCRIFVGGLVEIRDFCEVMQIETGDGQIIDPETLWLDYKEEVENMTNYTNGGHAMIEDEWVHWTQAADHLPAGNWQRIDYN